MIRSEMEFWNISFYFSLKSNSFGVFALFKIAPISDEGLQKFCLSAVNFSICVQSYLTFLHVCTTWSKHATIWPKVGVTQLILYLQDMVNLLQFYYTELSWVCLLNGMSQL